MVKVLELLAEDEVLEQGRAPVTSLQAELLPNIAAEICRHVRVGIIDLNILEPRAGVNLTALGTATKSRRVGEGACRQSSANKAAQR